MDVSILPSVFEWAFDFFRLNQISRNTNTLDGSLNMRFNVLMYEFELRHTCYTETAWCCSVFLAKDLKANLCKQSCRYIWKMLLYPVNFEYQRRADGTSLELCFHNKSMLCAPERINPVFIPQHADADYRSHLHQWMHVSGCFSTYGSDFSPAGPFQLEAMFL